MAEAMMMMSQDNTIASKPSFTGFLVIVISKNILNKNHFKSWHSILGLLFLVSFGITSSEGVITLYFFRLNQYLKPAKMKLLHNFLGVKSIATDGQSVSKSWCRAPSGAHDQIFLTF
jgi:hypothetical protein